MDKPRFLLLMNHAHHALKTRLERETRSKLGLTSLELTALLALSSEPGLGVQALAEVLHVDHAVVSRLSKQLVRKGVARRVTDPSDRRRSPLEVTDPGAAKAEEGLRILRRTNARITGSFADEELSVVTRFLEHLIRAGQEPGPLEEE